MRSLALAQSMLSPQGSAWLHILKLLSTASPEQWSGHEAKILTARWSCLAGLRSLACRATSQSGMHAVRPSSSCAAAEQCCALSGDVWGGRGRRGSWARRFEYEDPLKAAEREERDRRRAEVRRYPIDDTELHAELRDKAFSDGAPPCVL